MIGLILYEESREKSKTGEQPTEEHIKQQQDPRHDQSPFGEEQCLLFPDQQRAEYNTMVGVDTDTLTAPTSNFNKRMLREKEPETRLEQMVNLKYDEWRPE